MYPINTLLEEYEDFRDVILLILEYLPAKFVFHMWCSSVADKVLEFQTFTMRVQIPHADCKCKEYS